MIIHGLSENPNKGQPEYTKQSVDAMHPIMATKSSVDKIKTELKWIRILMLSVLGLLIKIAFFN
jgi:hypothetical protein|tara:strand:+ start:376 stop:567 length:192 start_codon:yes stop_codon:yes gene_type:complete